MTEPARGPQIEQFSTEIRRFAAGVETGRGPDALAVEEPLEIRLGFAGEHRAVSITMRTPGADAELAAGFLFTEGIVGAPAEIRAIRRCGPLPRARNTIRVDLADGVAVDLKRLERNFYTTSSCGVCGKSSLEALVVTGAARASETGGGPRLAAALIHRFPLHLRERQSVFDATGGLHAAALFDPEGRLTALREDVGRHNALDKLIGREFLAGRTPLRDAVLFLSGRASFELVQKAVMAGVRIVCAVGAPSSLAVEAAREFGLTLVGFVREDRFNVYAGGERIIV